MDKSSENQRQLIEKYVTGLMDESEADEFEAFILPRPDWQAQINTARAQFDEIHTQAWAQEIEKTRQLLTGPEEKSGFAKWFNWPLSLVPSGLAFLLGAVMVSTFNSGQLQISEIQTVELLKKRSSGGEQTIRVNKHTDRIDLNVDMQAFLRDRYVIDIKSATTDLVNYEVKPDQNKKITIHLTGGFNDNELITISLKNEPDGAVVTEYTVLIKEK